VEVIRLCSNPEHRRRLVKDVLLAHYSVQPLVMGVRKGIAVKVEVNIIDRAGFTPAFFVS
jgi:hypothetical protein